MGNQLKKISEERDSGAFRSLFADFYPKVKAMMLRQGADRDMAEEIAQDTMFAVWRKSHQFSDSKGSLSAWIYTIARNLRIDRMRKQGAWQRVYNDLETIERLRGEANELRSWDIEKGDIENALGKLPPEQLQVVQLAFIDGLSQNEIAEKLSLPLGTVKSRMRLAFEKLRFSVDGDR